jgi:hypothetical protein
MLKNFLRSIYQLQWVFISFALLAAIPFGGVHYLFEMLSSLGSYLSVATLAGLLFVPTYIVIKAVSTRLALLQGAVPLSIKLRI